MLLRLLLGQAGEAAVQLIEKLRMFSTLLYEIIDPLDFRPALQKLADSLDALRGNAVKFPQASVVLHGVHGQPPRRFQAAQNGVQGGLGDTDAAAQVLDDLIAVRIPPPQGGQNAYVQQAALYLWINHMDTPFCTILYNTLYFLSRSNCRPQQKNTRFAERDG